MAKDLYRKKVKINNYTQGGVITARVMANGMDSMAKSFIEKHPGYESGYEITISEIDTELEYWIIDGSEES